MGDEWSTHERLQMRRQQLVEICGRVCYGARGLPSNHGVRASPTDATVPLASLPSVACAVGSLPSDVVACAVGALPFDWPSKCGGGFVFGGIGFRFNVRMRLALSLGSPGGCGGIICEV